MSYRWNVRVTAVRVYDVALPLRRPFAISGGVMTTRRSLIVEVIDDAGHKGYGEAAPFELPFYSDETIQSALMALRDIFVPRVVGLTISNPAMLYDTLGDGVRGNHMAKAGLETAMWDLVARRTDLALPQLVAQRLDELGVPLAARSPTSAIESGVALGIPDGNDLGVLTREVTDALASGYRRVKIKISPGWDVVPALEIKRILAEAHPTMPFWVDANGSFDIERHASVLQRLDGIGLTFVEQPFAPEGMWDSITWERMANTPICLDESLVSDHVARQMIAAGGPKIWNLKVQRLGGLEETCRVYARGIAAGAKMWVGTMPETGLGAQAALAVAAQGGCAFPSDVEPSSRWYLPGVDLVNIDMNGRGLIQVPNRPADIEVSRLRQIF